VRDIPLGSHGLAVSHQHRRKLTQGTAARAHAHTHIHTRRHTKWQHVPHTLTGRVLKFIMLPSEAINYGMRELFPYARRYKHFTKKTNSSVSKFPPNGAWCIETYRRYKSCRCEHSIRFLGWRTVGLHVCDNVSRDVIIFSEFRCPLHAKHGNIYKICKNLQINRQSAKHKPKSDRISHKHALFRSGPS
jgi:hypothetical protein